MPLKIINKVQLIPTKYTWINDIMAVSVSRPSTKPYRSLQTHFRLRDGVRRELTLAS